MSSMPFPDWPSRGAHPCSCGYSMWHLLALGRLHRNTAKRFLATTCTETAEVLAHDLSEALVAPIPYTHADPVIFTVDDWEYWISRYSCRTPLEIAAILRAPLVVGWYPRYLNTPMHPVVRGAMLTSMRQCGWRVLP